VLARAAYNDRLAREGDDDDDLHGERPDLMVAGLYVDADLGEGAGAPAGKPGALVPSKSGRRLVLPTAGALVPSGLSKDGFAAGWVVHPHARAGHGVGAGLCSHHPGLSLDPCVGRTLARVWPQLLHPLCALTACMVCATPPSPSPPPPPSPHSYPPCPYLLISAGTTMGGRTTRCCAPVCLCTHPSSACCRA
jgi:hypothetical protein